jgi:uncharacterized protein
MSGHGTTCLVLMFKAPMRSKQRLHADIGVPARTVSEHLLACAVEDMTSWGGPVCFAPASRADAAWIRRHYAIAGEVIEQCEGNLGRRIEYVNTRLLEHGHETQIFIGSDCPGLTPAYLTAADAELAEHDAVVGPALDGGVVLMGTRGAWPPLDALPWSTETLMQGLLEAHARAGRSVALLDARADVDSASDLAALVPLLATDPRPARRALLRWLQSAGSVVQ